MHVFAFHRLLPIAIVTTLSACAGRTEAPLSILGEPIRQGSGQVVRQPILDPALEGVWSIKSAELGGKPFVFPADAELRIGGARYGVGVAGNYKDRGRVELFGDELAGQPRRLDTVGEMGPNKGKRLSALYRLLGRDLEIIYDLTGDNRPVDFVSREGTQLLRVTYVRKPS